MTKLMLAGLSLWLWWNPSLAGEVSVKQTGFTQVAARAVAVSEGAAPEVGRAPQADSGSTHRAQLIRLHLEAITPWLPPSNP